MHMSGSSSSHLHTVHRFREDGDGDVDAYVEVKTSRAKERGMKALNLNRNLCFSLRSRSAWVRGTCWTISFLETTYILYCTICTAVAGPLNLGFPCKRLRQDKQLFESPGSIKKGRSLMPGAPICLPCFR